MHTIIAFKYKAGDLSLLCGLSSFVQQLCVTHTQAIPASEISDWDLSVFVLLSDSRSRWQKLHKTDVAAFSTRNESRYCSKRAPSDATGRPEHIKKTRTSVTMQIIAAGLIKFSRNSTSIYFSSLILTRSQSLTLAVFPFFCPLFFPFLISSKFLTGSSSNKLMSYTLGNLLCAEN